jgi:hypothetical protein
LTRSIGYGALWKIRKTQGLFDICWNGFGNIILFQGLCVKCLLINELTNIKVNKNCFIEITLEIFEWELKCMSGF